MSKMVAKNKLNLAPLVNYSLVHDIYFGGDDMLNGGLGRFAANDPVFDELEWRDAA